MERKFKRILLKLSGESLMGEQQYGIDPKRAGEYATQIKEIADMGIEIGIVIGGGNMDDKYQSLEDARLFVIKKFPKNKIISFPQTGQWGTPTFE